jgi:hypothetical protein
MRNYLTYWTGKGTNYKVIIDVGQPNKVFLCEVNKQRGNKYKSHRRHILRSPDALKKSIFKIQGLREEVSKDVKIWLDYMVKKSFNCRHDRVNYALCLYSKIDRFDIGVVYPVIEYSWDGASEFSELKILIEDKYGNEFNPLEDREIDFLMLNEEYDSETIQGIMKHFYDHGVLKQEILEQTE